jgi:hypothetical protein
MGWTVWGSHPSGGKIFHAHPDRPWGPYYSNGTTSFPVVKRPGCGVDHPSPSSAEVKRDSTAIHLLCLQAFVAWLGWNLPVPKSFWARITYPMGTADSWNLNDSHIKAIKCQYLNLMPSIWASHCMTVIPDITGQRIRSINLIPNHTETSLYFMLRPNQTCQISQKQPTVQNKKICTKHKICVSLTIWRLMTTLVVVPHR